MQNLKVGLSNKIRAKYLVYGYVTDLCNTIPKPIIGVVFQFYYIGIYMIFYNDNSKNKNNWKYLTLESINNVYINCGCKLFLNDDNILHGFGDNSYAQLGLSHTQTTEYYQYNMQANSFFINDRGCQLISQGCKNEHIFIYTIKNKLYAFGANEKGQLGLKNMGSKIIRPTLVDINFTVKYIGNGFAHSIFISKTGAVYGCGSNNYGQLGLNTDERVIKVITQMDTEYLNNEAGIKCVCGYYHSNILTNNGNVFSCGDNSHAALGVGNQLGCSPLPTKITHLNKSDSFTEFIKDIQTGQDHAAILTNNNEIYLFGENLQGQCGIDTNIQYLWYPTKSIINEKYSKISIGLTWTILKLLNNNFVIFGDNKYGQLFENPSNLSRNIIKPKIITKEYILQLIGLNPHNNTSYNLDIYCSKDQSILVVFE